MSEPLKQVIEAFNRKAAVYDAFGEDHPNLARMRSKVRQRIISLVPPHARLLEINAGTGADAAYLAAQGYQVLATDIAPAMLERARARSLSADLEGRLEVKELSYTRLRSLESGPFDLVYSNMGGLNCIPDLRPVMEAMPGLLNPGGHVLVVVMPRICPWEWTALLRGDARTAFRRLKPGGTQANVEGVSVPTTYFSARQVERSFGRAFTRVKLESLALAAPPADRKSFAHRRPRLFRVLAGIDDRIAHLPPFRGWGDFFMLSMRRLP